MCVVVLVTAVQHYSSVGASSKSYPLFALRLRPPEERAVLTRLEEKQECPGMALNENSLYLLVY